jgi:hypothetical protein
VPTYGVISAGTTRYCLIPEDRSKVQDMPLFQGGPSARSFDWDRSTREVKTPVGDRVSGSKVIQESEIWTPGNLLVAIGQGQGKSLPVCPLSLDFLAQPAELLAGVLSLLSVDMANDKAVFHLNWDGIFCRKEYTVVMLPVGVAVWPPREVPGWSPHFLLLGPGTKETLATPPFKRFAPVAYGQGEGWQPGERKIYEASYLTMIRTEGAPRLVGFVDQQAVDPQARETPLGFSLMGPGATDISFLGFADWVERALQAPVAPPVTSPRELRVAIDFGTSNTAVAVRSGNEPPRLLSLDQAGRAGVPTASIGLDPYSYSNTAYRFFPTGLAYTNPLPTILLDLAEYQAVPFRESRSLPRFVIPPPRPVFDENEAQHYSTNGVLKQDFKWRGDDILRRAFLEQFALVVAYQLRRELSSLPQVLTLTGSYPLAYDHEQHGHLIEAFEDVQKIFERGGFQGVVLEELISESYANYLFIDEQYRSMNRNENGRLLVVDIGGGTTDICVSTEVGRVCYLDSLMIGGKDISEKLLPYRVLEQDRADQVLKALNLKVRPVSREDRQWCDALQYILIKKMKEGDGVRNLRASFQNNGMGDLLGELLALLTYATAYGARLALQPDPSKVKRLSVRFGGLGSRLFDMAPLPPPAAKPWEAAKRILLDVIKALPEMQDVAVNIDRFPEPKEAVCRGTALAKGGTGPAMESRTRLKTLWWSDIPLAGGGAIAWNSDFSAAAARNFSGDDIDGVQATPLLEIVEAAVKRVGEATFGNDWRPKGEAISNMKDQLPGYYRNGCSRLRDNGGGGRLVHYPIRQVTEGLKEILCAVIEE